MRTLHFVAHAFPVFNGYSFKTHYLAQNQLASGDQPAIVTCPEFAEKHSPSAPFSEVHDGVMQFNCSADAYRAIGWARRLGRGRNMVRRSLSSAYYRRVIRQCSPCHVFHCHQQPAEFQYLLPLSREYQVPLIYEVRGVWEDTAVACGELREDSNHYRKMHDESTNAALKADWVVCISEGLRQDFINRGVSGDKISVAPNGVDCDSFVPIPRDQGLAEKLGVAGKRVFGYISSIRELEGIEYLVRAMPEILKAVPDSACIIVGDGEDKARLESLVEELGLQGKVILTGRVPHEDIRAYYSIMNVFVIPRLDRRVNNIVTPLKPLEAMAMEKAVLVSGVGGLTELVQNEETGLVFEPESSADLAAKAIRLATDDELCARLGQQARRRVILKHDWGKVIEKYDSVTQAVLATG